ncbi:MAG: prolyl-tRNA synthetase associated domain-containing protein [Candidatus Saccharibacteria bacterium]|nr:prolyl-tRNA synthetase associated domain-containing protein [Candidatus Saccharibacteria bacterium]
MKAVLDFLDNQKISYDLVEHEPVHTIEDMEKLGLLDKGYVCKNLFLRNANGKIHYLICCHHGKNIKLDELREKIGSSKLSFASAERLEKYLKLEAGCVSPFGILNDESKSVIAVFDEDLKNEKRAGFHPNINTATLYLDFQNILSIIENHGNQYLFVKF